MYSLYYTVPYYLENEHFPGWLRMTASKHCHPGMCSGCRVTSPGECATLKAEHFPGWHYTLAWVTMLSCCHSQSPGEMIVFQIAFHRAKECPAFSHGFLDNWVDVECTHIYIEWMYLWIRQKYLYFSILFHFSELDLMSTKFHTCNIHFLKYAKKANFVDLLW